MHLGPEAADVELAFLLAWRQGYSLNYPVWLTGAVTSTSHHSFLLIFVPRVYANLQRWRAPEELLAYLRREFYMKCTNAFTLSGEQKMSVSCFMVLLEMCLILSYRRLFNPTIDLNDLTMQSKI